MNTSSSDSRRAHLRDYGSSLLPLMDVLFILVFFLMVAAARKAAETQLDIRLPDIPAGRGITQEDGLTLEVGLDGRVSADGRVYACIDDLLHDRTELPSRVGLRADGRMAYGKLLNVIQKLKAQGVTEVSLLALVASPKPQSRTQP